MNLSPNAMPMNEDYFIQRPHHNLVNKFFYSDFMKKYNPLHEWRSYHPYYHVRLANWYGAPPHATWVDGIIDYTYNKYNDKSIGHNDLHDNRKNKPYKAADGGDKVRNGAAHPLHPTYVYSFYPKGCGKEIHTYKKCVNNKKNTASCLEEKINIMEVCPKWVLEALRERKRFLMRATLIDNETYRRAMKVSTYNQNRSLRDIHEDVVEVAKIRSDGYWSDDRYNPTTYPSPDHNSNVNLGGTPIYNDTIGGNNIENIIEKRTLYSKSSYEDLRAQIDEKEQKPEKEQ